MPWDHDSPDDALAALCSRVAPVPRERVKVELAAGRVLAEDLLTDRPSPACDVSAMDGFAIRVADRALSTLLVSGEVRIGCEPLALAPGSALRIATGAAIPLGADAVVRIEDVTVRDDRVQIRSDAMVSVGAEIRRAGENAGSGATVARAGSVIDGAIASAIASFGGARVLVYERVRVAVIVTGDELVENGGDATRWQVKDSNGPALAVALGRAFVEIERLPRIPDDERALRDAITSALSCCDALVLTGGVSMGARDHVPASLRACGVDVLFHKLPQRPGKPVIGGIASGGRPVLGLPGNPVSVLVTARRLAAPAVGRRGGVTRSSPPSMVRLLPPSSQTISLWWHRPVRLGGGGTASIVESRGSSDVVAVAASDGFVEIPPGSSGEGPFPFYRW
jgi:molybdopterin molybdotransferase